MALLDKALGLAHPSLTAIIEQIELLGRRAYRSPVTELPNRVALEVVAGVALGDPSVRYGVAFMDLTGFKSINDAHTHAGGDATLRQAGALWRKLAESVGAESFHLSGDEFLMLVPTAQAEAFRRGWEADLSRFSLAYQGATIHAAANCGLALPAEDELLEVLQERADAACQVAKDRGDRAVLVWQEGVAAEPLTDRRWRCGSCGATNRLVAAAIRSGVPRACLNCTAPLESES